MRTVKISLYSFNELGEQGKRLAIMEHREFLDSTPIEAENEEGGMEDHYFEHEESEIINNILDNDYIFFFNGEQANTMAYTGKHPKSGIIKFNFKGQTFII